MNVSEYLLQQLKSLGVDHAFGVPGDFILPFFEIMAKSDIRQIAACNELNAGYAADGYARVRGMGLAVVTYGPGSFSLVNAVAGAHAEDVPMVVVSGGPARAAYKAKPNPLLHHLLPDNYQASMKIFEQITAHACFLDDPQTAAAEIDKTLDICLCKKKPVFIEIPKDVQLHEISTPVLTNRKDYRQIDTQALQQAATLLAERIGASKRTLILPGHEIHRWKLQDKLVALLQRTGIPAASMFVGKAEFLEHLPLCIGAYQGAASKEEVRHYVEEADTVIYLGAVPSDLNLGGFTAKLSAQQTVTIWNNKLEMQEGSFTDVPLPEFIDLLDEKLADNIFNDTNRPIQCFPHKPGMAAALSPATPLSSKRFYDRLADFFRPDDIVLADASCAFNLTHLQLPQRTTFIASNFWASIGMGFGATLGACFAASDKQRVVAVEGDGSFQMTAQELSSMIRYQQAVIVFIVNNNGYTAERFIHDGDFNDIPQWKYHMLPEVFGGGLGLQVRSEADLEAAFEKINGHNKQELILVEVHLDAYDVSAGFSAMCEAFRSH